MKKQEENTLGERSWDFFTESVDTFVHNVPSIINHCVYAYHCVT